MKARENNYNVFSHQIEKRIWKLAQKCTTDLLMYYLMRGWITLHA